MTRINGYRQIACPNCLKVYRTPSYGSINLSAYEHWSDGRKIGSLFDYGGGIRGCQCGQYYLMKNAIDMGLMSETRVEEVWCEFDGEPTYDIPAFLRWPANEIPAREVIKEWSLVKRLRNWLSPPEKPRTKRLVRREVPLPENSCEHIPYIEWAADSAMIDIINSPDVYGQEMVMVARMRYWPYLNDHYREPFKAYCKNKKLPIPEFTLSQVQRENLETLLENKRQESEPDWLTLGELQRELGEFNAALAYFGRIEQTPENRSDLEKLTRATKMRIAGPIIIFARFPS